MSDKTIAQLRQEQHDIVIKQVQLVEAIKKLSIDPAQTARLLDQVIECSFEYTKRSDEILEHPTYAAIEKKSLMQRIFKI